MVHHVKKEHVTITAIFIFAACYIVALPVLFFLVVLPKSKIVPVSVKNQPTQPSGIFNRAAFNGVQIEGKAFVIYDVTHNEVLAAKNETALLPLASLTKVMTAVSSTMHNSKQDIVTILPMSIEGGYDLGLRKGQKWTLSELLKYTLIFSSNDGAEAIADTFGGKDTFVAQMNKDAASFGLNFVFTDPAGRDLDGKIGGMGSALDAAKLFGVARTHIPEIFDATTKKRQTLTTSTGRVSGIPNTNQEIENLPGATASKTGYTDLAGGNLGVVVDITIGRPVVIIVLGSTRQGRFEDVSILYTALRKSLDIK